MPPPLPETAKLLKLIQAKTAATLRSLRSLERLAENREGKHRQLIAMLPKITNGLRELQSALVDLSREDTECSQLHADLEVIRKECEARLGVPLDEELRRRGLPALCGNLPQLKTGVFRIVVNSSSGKAAIWYGPEQELIETVPLHPKEIADAVARAVGHLRRSGFDEGSFLSRLHEAYVRTARIGGLPAGEGVPIISVLEQLALLQQDTRWRSDPQRKHYRSYGRPEFSYDLHRLSRRQHQGKELVLNVAARSQTRHRKDFLWVPTDEQGNGAVYASLAFREA
jgi:hypothetical protein